MFVPEMYREPDALWIVELMRRNPLALLVTNGADEEGPFGTHLPVVPDPQAVVDGLTDLAGTTLLGHLNRANPQWKALREVTPAVLDFTGPGAYVSPAVYGFTPAAPTWNYTAVQLRGVVERIDQGEQTLAVVQATVGCLEAEFGKGWDMSGSVDYFRKILPAVGAFRFTVHRAQAMFKLSQEQSAETAARVCSHLVDDAVGRRRETAEYMTRVIR